ncbi:MAG: lamin tail domain-containing protein, partial [Lacibacter sp.]
MNTSFFISGGDHTSGSGKMMVVDGNTTGGAQRFWDAGNTGGGVCGLTVGATYTFSFWIKSVATSVTDPSTQADIRIQLNNASVTSAPASTLAPLPNAGWVKVTYQFVPSNGCVNIGLWNENTNPVGNDFAVDDFELLPPPEPLSLSYTVTNVSCPGASDGAIIGYGKGGSLPYQVYTLGGAASQTKTDGVFTGLAPGTYTLRVRDQANQEVSVSSIVVTEPADLVVSAGTTICNGDPVTLSVSGGNGYTWTASPNDPTLTTPSVSNPVVRPTVNTVYTVQSSVSNSVDLIFNGNFSLGNLGFYTDYKYYTPANTNGVQRAYGIVTNSNTWFSGFGSCTGRGGTGNMMVFDGSAFNSGNDKVWCQTVAVKPSQSYTFTYYIQSLVASNLANIEVFINGVKIGTDLAPNTTCSWLQRSYNWNSGASTLAQICIYDRTVATTGNDFALDDISFTTTINCLLTKTVNVTVNNCACPIQLAPSSTPNTNCNPAVCTYTGPKVRINELHIQPASGNQIIRRADLATGSEWIELYNPNPCQAIDLSCFMLGNYSTEASGTVQEPAVIFFPPGTTIPPLGFLTIGGPSTNADLKPPTLVNGLVGNRLYLPGGLSDGGWIGIWDDNGNPIDAVYWMDPTRNINSAFATGSFAVSPGTINAGNVPFNCPYRGTLPTARQLEGSGGPISRIGGYASNGQFQFRSTDGGAAWTFNSATNTIGACNAACATPFNSGCTGTATVVATGGQAPYTYKWNDPLGQTTATATGLCAGQYCVDVKDANQNCVANICVTVQDNCCASITLPSASQPICIGGDPSVFTVNTTATGTNAITYKYYTSIQTGTAMYTGGTVLGTVTPSGGIASYNAGVLGSAGSLPNTPNTYYVYAILNPTPASAACRPFQEIIVTVNPLPATPTASVTIQPTCTTPTG